MASDVQSMTSRRAMLMRRAAFMLSCGLVVRCTFCHITRPGFCHPQTSNFRGYWFSQMLLLFTWPSVSRRHLLLAAASTAATPSRSKAVEQTSDVQCIRDMAIKNALRESCHAMQFFDVFCTFWMDRKNGHTCCQGFQKLASGSRFS